VRVVGDELQVFYTQRGDSPERVQFSTIDLGVADWEDWSMTYPGEEILEAIPGWEGGQFQPAPSEVGAADEDVNELRDPGIFEDTDGSLYLIYAGSGEDALGIARLSSPSVLVGDMNGDGVIDFSDIPPFILALSDPPAYRLANPNLIADVSGDTNGDGSIDFGDIPGFINLLRGS